MGHDTRRMKLVFNDLLYAQALEALVDRFIRQCVDEDARALLLRVGVKAWNLAVTERGPSLPARLKEEFEVLVQRERLDADTVDQWRKVFMNIGLEKANLAPHLDNKIHKAQFLEERPFEGPAIDVTSIQIGPASSG